MEEAKALKQEKGKERRQDKKKSIKKAGKVDVMGIP
jgi:hypothetical protein